MNGALRQQNFELAMRVTGLSFEDPGTLDKLNMQMAQDTSCKRRTLTRQRLQSRRNI
jgi:hypothetical protein